MCNALEICCSVSFFEYPLHKQFSTFASNIFNINDSYSGPFISFELNTSEPFVLAGVLVLINLEMFSFKSRSDSRLLCSTTCDVDVEIVESLRTYCLSTGIFSSMNE